DGFEQDVSIHFYNVVGSSESEVLFVAIGGDELGGVELNAFPDSLFEEHEEIEKENFIMWGFCSFPTEKKGLKAKYATTSDCNVFPQHLFIAYLQFSKLFSNHFLNACSARSRATLAFGFFSR